MHPLGILCSVLGLDSPWCRCHTQQSQLILVLDIAVNGASRGGGRLFSEEPLRLRMLLLWMLLVQRSDTSSVLELLFDTDPVAELGRWRLYLLDTLALGALIEPLRLISNRISHKLLVIITAILR